MTASVGYGNWSAGYFLCSACAKDPDPRGWTACSDCRALNASTVTIPGFCSSCEALRAELESYRSLPVIPIADHRRACDARDAALAQLDALTAKVQRLEDSRTARVTDEALRLLAGLVRQLEKTGGYSLPHEQSQLMEARALLAECG